MVMSNQIDNIKIANTLIYLRSKLPNLLLTKALKLLYILDETSIIETGVPFTWMEYKAWKMGPVPRELYDELKETLPNNEQDSFYSQFITVNKDVAPNDYDAKFIYSIECKKDFSDDEFSEYDIELMERIITEYGNKSASEIINILHQKDSLWHKVVSDNNLENQFRLMNNKSNFTIPFTDLLVDDELKQMAYSSAFESHEFHSDFAL